MSLRRSTLLAATACCWALAPALYAAGPGKDRQQELEGLRERVSALQQELAASEETRDEAADALKQSEQAISDANRRLFELAGERAAAQGQLADLRGEVQDLQRSLNAQRSALEKLLQQQYQGGRYEPFRLLLSGQDPQTISRLLHYYRILAQARAEALRTLQGSYVRTQALTEQQEAKQRELEAIETQAQDQKAALERERGVRAKVLARTQRQASLQKRRLASLQADEKRLTRLVERLARIVEAPRARPAPRGESGPDPALGDAPFAQLRGKLPPPVQGELANRFGSPRSDGGATWKGLFFKCGDGQEVRAVAAGQVVFADWLRGFGNLLILDHGYGYMSLYGNNDALLRPVGAAVKEGEAIAQAGKSGGNSDSGVYFELRFQGTAFDPGSWLAR